jgi:hypothetical protein
LHWLYLWYENKPALALSLLQGLDARYPSNPVFLRRIAEVQDEYFHDHAASAAAWRALIDRARARRVARAPMAIAQLGLGREYEHLGQRDLALAAYESVIAIAAIDDPDHIRAQAREALRRLRNARD